MAFSLKQAFLSPQHDHQTSCWSGTYIILINSLRYKEECLCNCMELHRNSPWTPHISFSVCKLWAAQRCANSFCWAALHHLLGKEFSPHLSLAACGLGLLCSFPFMNITGKPSVQTEVTLPLVVPLRESALDVRAVSWQHLCDSVPSADGAFFCPARVHHVCSKGSQCLPLKYLWEHSKSRETWWRELWAADVDRGWGVLINHVSQEEGTSKKQRRM